MATIRANGRVHLRVWSRPPTWMVAIDNTEFSCKPGETHYKTVTNRILIIYVSIDYTLANIWFSRRSHETCSPAVRERQSHEERIVTLAFAIRLKTLGKADKRGRSEAPSVRFVRSAWDKNLIIWEKKVTISNGFIMRFPWVQTGKTHYKIVLEEALKVYTSWITFLANIWFSHKSHELCEVIGCFSERCHQFILKVFIMLFPWQKY